MGDSEAAAADDLDALIGDIRREAARRRAAPDFPVDEEARLSADMDAQGPAGIGGADLAALTSALRSIEKTGDAGVSAATAQVAGLAASAIRALAVRLGELERRVDRPSTGTSTGTSTGPGRTAATAPLVATWRDELLATVGPEGGRILVAGAGAAEWVDLLCAGGLDGYGVDPYGDPFGDQGAIRSGSVLEHLRTVGPGALAAAVITGTLPGPEAERLDELAGELARTSRRVVVCSEAPWAWRRRVGDADADTSPGRPVGPEAWLQALAAAGVEATGRYDSGGLSYMLGTERPGRVEG